MTAVQPTTRQSTIDLRNPADGTVVDAVIAVDPVEFKRDTAKFFGATDTSPSVEEAIPLVHELTKGVMADRVVLTPSVLHAELLAPALRTASSSRG